MASIQLTGPQGSRMPYNTYLVAVFKAEILTDTSKMLFLFEIKMYWSKILTGQAIG